MPPDIRWQRRFANFCQALDQLEDTLRLAFRVGLIRDGEAWLAMVQDRNLTSHTYNRSTAEQVSEQVGTRYLPCFRELRLVLSERVQATAAGEGHG